MSLSEHMTDSLIEQVRHPHDQCSWGERVGALAFQAMRKMMDCPLGHPGTAPLKSTSREENARHWRCCGLGRPPGASVATGDPLWVALGRVGARIGALQRDQGAHPPRLMVVIPSPKPLLTGPTRRVSSCFCDGWRPRTCGLRVDQPWDASARDGARTAARNARGARRRAALPAVLIGRRPAANPKIRIGPTSGLQY